MFTSGCNYSKLKTNLQLAAYRLKMLQKKRSELVQKSRKEIADYLANGNVQKSKIRVEQIILEDYFIETLEIIEMYCDLLSARFGLLEQLSGLDEGLAEAISSLIWAAPRLQTDIAELKVIADQFAFKFGKQYALAARNNTLNSVNEKLVLRLNIKTPPKVLVEKYLIEIAKSHSVPYEPDAGILAAEEARETEVVSNLIEFDDYKTPVREFEIDSSSNGGSLLSLNDTHPQSKPFNYPSTLKASPNDTEMSPQTSAGELSGINSVFTGISPDEKSAEVDTSAPFQKRIVIKKPSTVPKLTNTRSITTNNFTRLAGLFIDSLPELPSVPNSLLPGAHASANEDENNEIDVEELKKRFEELKRR